MERPSLGGWPLAFVPQFDWVSVPQVEEGCSVDNEGQNEEKPEETHKISRDLLFHVEKMVRNLL